MAERCSATSWCEDPLLWCEVARLVWTSYSVSIQSNFCYLGKIKLSVLHYVAQLLLRTMTMARVLVAFGDPSASRQALSLLCLPLPPLTAHDTPRRHPSSTHLSQRDATHGDSEAPDPAGNISDKHHMSHRHQPSQPTVTQQGSTSAMTVAKPHMLRHTPAPTPSSTSLSLSPRPMSPASIQHGLLSHPSFP